MTSVKRRGLCRVISELVRSVVTRPSVSGADTPRHFPLRFPVPAAPIKTWSSIIPILEEVGSRWRLQWQLIYPHSEDSSLLLGEGVCCLRHLTRIWALKLTHEFFCGQIIALTSCEAKPSIFGGHDSLLYNR